MFRLILSTILLTIFCLTEVLPPAWAQEALLPPADRMITVSQPLQPLLMQGMRVDVADPLQLDFLFEEGSADKSGPDFNQESLRLIKYFLASLTIPNQDLWVNLSPYESQRVVQEDLGRTAMGRDLLAQDYILKQLTAGLLHPDGDTGKAFWGEIYRRSFARFGTTDIPIETFNKVWIVPGGSLVVEGRSQDGKKMSAFVDKLELDVLLESDYVAMGRNLAADSGATVVDGDSQRLAQEILREVVIPVLKQEVNTGSNFALLRQVCYSLILASWFKRKLEASVRQATETSLVGDDTFTKVFVNQRKTGGIEISDPRAATQMVYDRYVEAFRKGAYNLIREEVDAYSQEPIPRKYFSGGFTARRVDDVMTVVLGTVDSEKQFGRKFRATATRLAPRSGDAAQRSPINQKVRTWTIRGLIGILSLGSAAEFFNQRKLLPEQYQFSQHMMLESPPAPIHDQPLNARSMLNNVRAVTEGKRLYDSGVKGEEVAGIPPEKFLAGVLGTSVPEGLSPEGRERWMEKSASMLSSIIHEGVTNFGSDLVNEGLSEQDIALFLSSLMMRESNGDMKATNKSESGAIIARGVLQLEYATSEQQLKLAQEVLQDMPGKKFQSLLNKVQNEIQNPRGDPKKNIWTSNSRSDLVASQRDNLWMAIMWFNRMVNSRPETLRTTLNKADAQLLEHFGIVPPESVQKEINTPALTLGEFMQSLRNDPQYKGEKWVEAFFRTASALWNGGINRDTEELRSILQYIDLPADIRIQYQHKAVEETARARIAMMKSIGNVRRILQDNGISPAAVLS
ncbi:MAG: hypothetical protein HGA80_01965, partial [Candidatus Omnitrophica bacterium]|nr:hypothetical protein [Candidatus Omnitrophota bacterium]